MTNDDCQRYLEEPEAHPEHLAGCESCRAFAATMAQRPAAKPVTLGALPLAKWEGAAHRSWPLLLLAAAAVAAAALAVIVLSGAAPVDLFRTRIPSGDVLMSLVTMAGGAMQNAPRGWQVGILVAFLVVNAIFIALLRRAPKGIDV